MDAIKNFVIDQTEHKIDILFHNTEPVFRADQIGRVLGLVNVQESIAKFDSDQKAKVSGTDVSGRPHQVTVLTEEGVYQLLFASRKDIAKVFKKWVCSVLKEIRTKGKYEVEEKMKEIAEKEEFVRQQQTAYTLLVRDSKIALQKAKHDDLVNVFHDQAVVYVAVLTYNFEPDKHIIKIGSSDNIRQRVTALKKDFGAATLVAVYSCTNNLMFERYLQNNEKIKVKRFGGMVNDKKLSSETFLMTDGDIQHVLNTAGRNVSQFIKESEMSQVKRILRQIVEKLPDAQDIVLESDNDADDNDDNDNDDDDDNDADDDDDDDNDDDNDNDGKTAVLGKRKASSEPATRGHATKGKVGSKLQKYTADGKTLLKTYDGIIDALRDEELLSPKRSAIATATSTNRPYLGCRWKLLDRTLPDDTVQELEATTAIAVQASVKVLAEMNLTKTEISQTFANQKAVAIALGKKCSSRTSKAIKAGEPIEGHYYVEWNLIAQEIKDAYLESGGALAILNTSRALKVQQIDAKTMAVVNTWNTRHEISVNNAVSQKKLRQAIGSGKALNGFVYKNV